jgi:hypothetical protein
MLHCQCLPYPLRAIEGIVTGGLRFGRRVIRPFFLLGVSKYSRKRVGTSATFTGAASCARDSYEQCRSRSEHGLGSTLSAETRSPKRSSGCAKILAWHSLPQANKVSASLLRVARNLARGRFSHGRWAPMLLWKRAKVRNARGRSRRSGDWWKGRRTYPDECKRW